MGEAKNSDLWHHEDVVHNIYLFRFSLDIVFNPEPGAVMMNIFIHNSFNKRGVDLSVYLCIRN